MGLSFVRAGGIALFLGLGQGLGQGLGVGLGLSLGIIYQLYQTTRTGQNKSKNVKLSVYERRVVTHRVDPRTMQITWRDIAGLEEVINELKEKMIFPVQKRHLFRKSRLLQPPKGVLLYGPPGCGKTLIAKATAKEAGFAFINLKPSTLTDKWYGESQK
ncbi:outer mitochondrial transmembrane helix translocase-like, partial [Haplochromis burtoni]|uniref:outer mitochondrial transmembrane helix translocase-like n=1 Tax=Haplochromis burtoni TaxID=8153 RepID=UPI001C2D66B1